MDNIRVYLDDERITPDGWVRVYWPEEAIALLESGAVTELSLDHDLGDDEKGTGYDVILWIENAIVSSGFSPPRIYIHSSNPSARQKMAAGIESIARLAAIYALRRDAFCALTLGEWVFQQPNKSSYSS